jgi:hypothetical protein
MNTHKPNDDQLRGCTEERPLSGTASTPAKIAGSGHFSRWKHLRRSNFVTQEDIAAHVDALRDDFE